MREPTKVRPSRCFCAQTFFASGNGPHSPNPIDGDAEEELQVSDAVYEESEIPQVVVASAVPEIKQEAHVDGAIESSV